MSDRQKIIVLSGLIILAILLDWLGREKDVTIHQHSGDVMGPQFSGLDMPGLYAPDFNSSTGCRARSDCGCDSGPPLVLALPPMAIPPVQSLPNFPQMTFETNVPEFQMPEPLELAYTPPPKMTIHKSQNQTGYKIDFDGPVPNLKKVGMNDRTRSITVHAGQWEVCRNVEYGGDCIILGPGKYSGLEDLGTLYKGVSSMRPITVQ